MFDECLTTGLNDEDCLKNYRMEIRIAEKELRCCECGEIISIGSKYEFATGTDPDYPEDRHEYITCLPCVGIWETLFQGQRLHEGMSELLDEAGYYDFWLDPPEDEDEEYERDREAYWTSDENKRRLGLLPVKEEE